MRFNTNEVIRLSQEIPDWEGKLFYIPPEKSSQASIIKSGAKSAAKLGNGLVKSIAGVGVTGQVHPPPPSLTSDQANNGRNRWFRVKANLLFYFRLTPEGRKPPLPGTEPLGVLVLEHFHVQKEGFEEIKSAVVGKNQFSLIFADEPDKRHFFIAENMQRATQWETALKQASYQRLRERLLDLQIKLLHKTGDDPLVGSTLQNNPMFSSKVDYISHSISTHGQPDISCSDNLSELRKAQSMPARTAPPPPASIIPPPRSKKQNKKKTFQSHIVNDWESLSPIVMATEASEEAFIETVNKKSATFQSHLPTDVTVDNLIQF